MSGVVQGKGQASKQAATGLDMNPSRFRESRKDYALHQNIANHTIGPKMNPYRKIASSLRLHYRSFDDDGI
jgi:hypothetical protein